MRTLVVASCLALVGAAFAEDVPQFRGQGGLGVTSEKSLPVNFGEGENLRYKVPLPGRGLSNPVIAGGRIYLTACSDYQEKKLHVLCLDQKDGRLLWERRLTATGVTLCHPKTNMAAPTPITDGNFVYALFATGDLVCFDKDGNLQWYRSLVGDYPTVGNAVGMAASPVLHKDVLIVDLVNVGESFVAGLDAKTGENRWRLPRKRDINWVTPLVIRNGDRDELIVQSGDGLFAHDPASGKALWSITDKRFLTIPSATFADGMILTPAEKFFAVRPGTDKAPPEIVWQSQKLPTGYASPVSGDGRVYTVATKGVLNCADAKTGKALWDMRLEGEYSASPLLAGNILYVVSEQGLVSVIEVGAMPKALATNPLDDKIMASPVASNGALYFRSDKYLYCFGGKAGK